MTRAQLDKRPADVAAMFDAVAGRYDLLNDVLSLGQCRYWRSVVARLVAARQGSAVLDIAAGTGTSARAFTAAGARCVACDFSQGMLRVGASRAAAHRTPAAAGVVSFVAGDALALPFADASVRRGHDLLRAAQRGRSWRRADRDAPGHQAGRTAGDLRVQSPAGGARSTRPTSATWPSVLPAVAGRLSPNPGAYAYLAESIRDWPAQAGPGRADPRGRLVGGAVAQPHLAGSSPCTWEGGRGEPRAARVPGIRGGSADRRLRARLSASVLVKAFTRLAGRVSERAEPPG